MHLLLNQIMKAGIKDIREIAEMALVDMEIMRNWKMGNLVRVGKVDSYLILQIINSSLSLRPPHLSYRV